MKSLVLVIGLCGILFNCHGTTSGLQVRHLKARSYCRLTGWIDRVEGSNAVVDEDGSDIERVLPVTCFVDPIRGGERVVDGKVDYAATEQMKLDIKLLMEELIALHPSP
jgi:hypothetical protein